MYNSKEYHKEYYKNNKDKLNKINRENYYLNKEKNKEHRKEYSIENSEKIKEKCKKWRVDNKEKSKEWYENNKEKLKEDKKEYRLKNKEKIKEDYRKWRLDNKEEINEKYRIYIKNRKIIDPIFKMQYQVRKLIGSSFKRCGYKKNTKTEKILGCSFENFKIYIENQFEDWMTFENYGKYNGKYYFGWDIDHIIELKNVKTLEDIINLNHYLNLRPLDSKINRVDRNKKESYDNSLF